MSATDYLTKMTEGMNFFETILFIIKDTIYSFRSLSIIDTAILVVILLLFLSLMIWVVSYIVKFGRQLANKTKPFLNPASRNKAIKQKIRKHEILKIKKRTNGKLVKQNKKNALESERKQKEEQQRKELKDEAISVLNYGFFVPENGYPCGPDKSIRFLLETERVKIYEGRTLTNEERNNVANGHAYDGGKFGDEDLADTFSFLFKKLSSISVKNKAKASLSSKPVVQSTGKVVQFKPKK